MTDYRNAFHNQKTQAKKRGIGWALTFEQWLTIWGERIADRGRRRDQLCMSRFGDTGPYAVGNVKIITNAENLAERKEWSDAKRREFGERRKQQFANPEHRKKMSDAARRSCADPVRRKEMSNAAHRLWSDPVHRLRISDATRKLWANPAHRQRVSASVKASWLRRRSAEGAPA